MGLSVALTDLTKSRPKTVDLLVQILEKSGFVPELSPYLYGDENGMVGTARERAQALMNFYRDDSVEEIFDVSGGDLANEILPYLDFQTIAYGKKAFLGIQ